jgi:PadR family transcriptional regulator PadR
MTTLRLTHATRLVATYLLAHPDGDYGLAIARATGLDRRAVPGVLRRLATAGYASREVEQADPREAGRPRRHYYQLTDDGQAWATAVLARRS